MVERPRHIDVQDFLNEQPFSTYQWLVFGICITVVLLDGFDTAAIGYIAPSLLGEWNLAKSDLGPVLSAALFGLAAGALFAGPLADNFGRKLVLIVSVVVMGAASLVAATADNLHMLTIWRFVTGLGLGAAMPNAVTLMSEYCPNHKRALITNAMFCGFPVGAAFGGFLAAWIIPQFGWRSVLILGGAAPLVLAALMLVGLPESVRFMVARRYAAESIRAVLVRISRVAAEATSFTMNEPIPSGPVGGRRGLGIVLSSHYLIGTVMLWIAYFMGLVIFYGLINWMPILFKESGVPPQQATLISALFPLGGFGAIFFGWLMDRHNANIIIAVGYALTAFSVYVIGHAVGNVGMLTLAVFVAGVLMNTAQSSMPALAAAFYPTQGRASGISWMLGIGRFGGIAGSFLVAELAQLKFSLSDVFLIVAVPGAISALAIVIKGLIYAETKMGPIPVEPIGH